MVMPPNRTAHVLSIAPQGRLLYLLNLLYLLTFWRPAGGSRPLIGSNLRNRRFPILAAFAFLCALCGCPRSDA